MRFPMSVSLRVFVSSAVALSLLMFPVTVSGVKPPEIPAWHDGEIVFFTVVNENVDGRNAPQSDEVALPFYAFGPPGMAPQFEVLASAPGVAGYSPWWHVFVVIPTDGRDLTADPFTSEQEILDAVAMGDAILIDTGFVFLCQVLPGKNR